MAFAGHMGGAIPRSSREDKADVTTREANRIIAAETKAREDKTARLRQLRLEQEAAAAGQVAEPAAPARGKRTSKATTAKVAKARTSA